MFNWIIVIEKYFLFLYFKLLLYFVFNITDVGIILTTSLIIKVSWYFDERLIQIKKKLILKFEQIQISIIFLITE